MSDTIETRVETNLESLAPTWKALVERVGAPATQGPGWAELCWSTSPPPGGERRRLAISFHAGSTLVGVLPLFEASLPLRRLSSPGFGHAILGGGRAGLVATPGQEQAIVVALAQCMRAGRLGAWDVLELGRLPPDVTTSLTYANLRGLGAGHLLVSGSERYAALAPASASDGALRTGAPREPDAEAALGWLAQTAGLHAGDLARACDVLHSEGGCTIGWIGAPSAAAIVTTAGDRAFVFKTCAESPGTSEDELALHRALMARAAAAGAREYVFWHAPPGAAAIAPLERPTRTLVLERVNTRSRLRGAARLSRDLASRIGALLTQPATKLTS
jgi:hypothetical protein